GPGAAHHLGGRAGAVRRAGVGVKVDAHDGSSYGAAAGLTLLFSVGLGVLPSARLAPFTAGWRPSLPAGALQPGSRGESAPNGTSSSCPGSRRSRKDRVSSRRVPAVSGHRMIHSQLASTSPANTAAP